MSIPKLPVIGSSPRIIISWDHLETKDSNRRIDDGWNKMKMFLLEEEDRLYLKEHDRAKEARKSIILPPASPFKYSIKAGLERPVRKLIQQNNK